MDGAYACELTYEECPPPPKYGGGGYSWEAFIARLTRFDFIVVYLSLLILAVLLILVVFFGSSTPFSMNLVQSNINPWIPRAGWVIATILSYGAFFFIYQSVLEYPAPQDFIVSILYLVSSFLFLGWAVAFYYDQDIVLSMWIAVIIFVYNYWLFIYVWYLSPIAALFLIPLLVLYGYLVYTGAHTASLNGQPI
jgi:hypothetical protein